MLAPMFWRKADDSDLRSAAADLGDPRLKSRGVLLYLLVPREELDTRFHTLSTQNGNRPKVSSRSLGLMLRLAPNRSTLRHVSL